jgi:hypothetical protein
VIEPTLAQRLGLLQEQQSAVTRALAAMDSGRWAAAEYGADSVEAWLLALNPSWQDLLQPQTPAYSPPAPPPPEPATVVWVPSPNCWFGRSGWGVVAITLHTMAGTLESCDSWFSNPNSQVSAHFGAGLDGELHQYVALKDSAWANGILEPGNQWTPIVGNSANPNYQTVSIETEDNGSGATPVTEQQQLAVIQAGELALQQYPSIRYLMGHNVISPSSRAQCCGDRWWGDDHFAEVAQALGLEAIA